MLVLPLIFDDSDANEAFKDSDDAVTIIKALSKKLNGMCSRIHFKTRTSGISRTLCGVIDTDAAFRQFLQKHKVKYIPDELEQKLK